MSDDRLATFKRVLAACARGRKWTDEAAAEMIGMVDDARTERDAARQERDELAARVTAAQERGNEWKAQKELLECAARRHYARATAAEADLAALSEPKKGRGDE